MPDVNKNKSDTIEQQKKAREEFLKLKQMQSGELPAPPPPSAEAVMPVTFNDKAKNFWFYYRWVLAAVLFLIVLLAVCIKQCASRINYDLSVTVYVSSPIGDDDTQKMSEYFEKICDDVNGDGEVHVGIYNCSYAPGTNKQMMYASDTKLQAILTSEYDAMLFITDDVTFDRLNSIDSIKTLFDDTVTLGADFNEFCEADDLYTIPAGLKLSRRIISGTVMKNNKKAAASYKAAGKVLEKTGQSGK